ncbi:peptidase [Desulfocucumis palustris]|uniref:Peptidase n=1 Tax=Desulfocucumis palustris TaxID=1898651 RepID=A0A2L2XDM6_9FIRM|nr:U32 family peptidase [Desulfocucumis palustris]GBF34242.1 peptidase [Desulfocucumis palustris]
MKRPELLAPAGDMEKLKAAVVYGADAVYLGGKSFGLRMGAENFDPDGMRRAVEFAHARGVKVYVTVNIFAHNRDLDNLPGYLGELRDINVDGIIVADPGVFSVARKEVPELPVHVSTQANITNRASAAFWESIGARRLVLARELSLEEIAGIRESVALELEVFVHGAMCISYSGRCLLSNYMTGRDANLGDCAQACRWRYALQEEKRPGQYFPVGEDKRGTYILSSRDLCLLDYLPELIRAGVGSLKIEGRVKGVHYVATVVKVYRQAIDRFMADPEGYRADPAWWEELGKVSNRDYTTGFISGPVGSEGQGHLDKIYRRQYTFVGTVENYHRVSGVVEVQQRNRFAVGETLEVLAPPGKPQGIFKVEKMYDGEGGEIENAPHPCQKVLLPVPFPLEPGSLLRRREQTG